MTASTHTSEPEPLRLAGVRLAEAGASRSAPVDLEIVGGRVASIGPATGAAPPGPRRIDGAGTWAIPGFVDPHVHLVMAARALAETDLTHVDGRSAFEAAIAAAAAAPERRTDGWIIARGWDESRWDGTMPDAGWLAAAGDRPALAWRMDIHAAVLNEPALARCDLREPVPGGTIVRGDDGRPTGLLLEAAAWERAIPVLPVPTPAEDRAAVAAAVEHAHARGIVALGSMEELDGLEHVLVPMATDGSLGILVRAMVIDDAPDIPVARIRAIPSTSDLRVIALKAFADGTLGSRTARFLEPYADAPDESGLWTGRARDGGLVPWASQVARAGFGVAIHAIGDAAVRAGLDALDAVHAIDPSLLRRLEHAQHVDDQDFGRFRGIFASMQPGHRIGDRATMDDRIGAARAKRAFPYRSLQTAGARLAFGSDWPVIDCDPLDAIASAVAGVTRGSPRPDGEEIAVETALAAHAAGAWASIDEPERGCITPGSPADLVLLDRDPYALDWSRERPRIVAVMAGGRVVHEA